MTMSDKSRKLDESRREKDKEEEEGRHKQKHNTQHTTHTERERRKKKRRRRDIFKRQTTKHATIEHFEISSDHGNV